MRNSLLASCRSIPITIITICVLHIHSKHTTFLLNTQIKVIFVIQTMKKRIKHMEKLNKVLSVLICALVLYAVIKLFSSCSVERRIDWHERQLDKYEKLYPELFTTAGIDSIIKVRALQLVGEMSKDIDKQTADSLQNEFNKLLASVKSLKESAQPCDTVLKEVERIVEVHGKQKVLYREAQCKMDTVRKDTTGVHVRAWGHNGKAYISVQVDSIRVKYDCPPEPKCFEKEWWDYRQSKCALIVGVILLFGIVVLILKK